MNTTKEEVEEEKETSTNLPEITLIETKAQNVKKIQIDPFSPIFDFNVLEPIAQGKMSLVHKAVNLNTNQDIIVKYCKFEHNFPCSAS